ncbi:FHA domain-containing protein [Pedobacter sp. JCM 36344]|uniref:FHA domain-containing protein n=1 Tax=Pedobacter sp. JCM 36344 TaxID=3374280 RepID=UPI0039797A30
MFNLFNNSAQEKPQDVKAVREAFLVFIKQELQKLEGGEGTHIKGLQLCICCKPSEEFMYESAVFSAEENRFKNEIQRIADDFAIDLPENWTMETIFVEELPERGKRMEQLNAALCVKLPEHVSVVKSSTGYIKILTGEAEQSLYTLKSDNGRINIGRGRKAQGTDGFFRNNEIAFPDESSNECNKYISRQHAHIEWNNESASFMLFADEGGVPPRNKVKIRSKTDHNPVKLTFTELGFALTEGDQIILGESAVLEFSYNQ